MNSETAIASMAIAVLLKFFSLRHQEYYIKEGFIMAERVLAIQVGQNITRVAEVDGKTDKMRAYHAFAFQTPGGTFDDRGIIQSNPQFRNYLNKLLTDTGITTRKVVFLISANKIGTKEESLPDMKEKQMNDYIKTNIKQFFPLEISQYQIVHRINGSGKVGEKRVQMYAIPREIITAYKTVAEFCGLNIVDMELLENAIAEVMKKTRKTGVGANIDIEEDHSVLTIVKDGGIEFQRMIPYGFSSVVEDVMEENIFGENLSYMEVLSKLRQNDSFYAHLEDLNSGNSRLKNTTTEDVRHLIGNLTRMIDYYSSQHQDTTIPFVTIEGLGSDNRSFMTLVQNEFPLEVNRMASSEGNIVRNLKEISSPSFYFVNAIAPFHPIGIELHAVDSKEAKDIRAAANLKVAIGVFAVCCAIAIGLAAFQLVRRQMYNSQITTYQAQIDSLAPAKVIYDKYNATMREYNSLAALDSYSNTDEQRLPRIIKELQDKIPSGVDVLSLDASTGGVTLNMTAPDKDTAGLCIAQLRTMTDIDVASVDSLNSSGGEDGAPVTYSFAVSLTYRPDSSVTDAKTGDYAGDPTVVEAPADGTEGTDNTNTTEEAE